MAITRNQGEELESGPADWTDSEETILIHLMLREIEKGNKPSTTFSKKGWKNIELGFKEKTSKGYSYTQFRNKFNQLRIRYNEFCMLLNERGFNLDPVLGQLTATDDVWKSAIKANKKAKRFRKRGCPLYNELRLIYGEPVGNSQDITPLAQYSLDTEVKCGLEDQSTNASPSESIRASSDEEDYYPSRSVRQRCEELPSPINEVKGQKDLSPIVTSEALGSTQVRVPSRASNKKHAEVAHMQTPTTSYVGTVQSSSPFSITNCVKCLESIQGIDAVTYLKAIKMFKDVDWREMFMAMSAERRLNWLASLD